MEYMKFILSVLFVVFAYIAIIGILMRWANLIGKQLGFGKLFNYLLRKWKVNKP